MLSTQADTNPGRESTSDLTYCPKKARNMSVFSAWYCFNRVRQPVTKGGASKGSVGFLLTNPPRKTIVYSAKNKDSILRMVGKFVTMINLTIVKLSLYKHLDSHGYDKAGYKILDLSEGHMHCDVIV